MTPPVPVPVAANDGGRRPRFDHTPMEHPMTEPTEPTPCGCGHEPHSPNTECETPVHHGPSHMHLCLCLNRPGAALACPPQMTCQGGTLGYTDIWYLQRGQGLLGLDGSIHPDALIVEPRGPRASAEGALQQRIAAVLREAIYVCDEDCDAPDDDACHATHPIQVGTIHHDVVTDLYGPVEALAAVLAPLVAKERADAVREGADVVAADTGHIRYGSATDYAQRHAGLLRARAAAIHPDVQNGGRA